MDIWNWFLALVRKDMHEFQENLQVKYEIYTKVKKQKEN